MRLGRQDVWGHFAPMFHLVDVFAVYAITLVGGRHVTLPEFTPQQALLAIGACGCRDLLLGVLLAGQSHGAAISQRPLASGD